MGSVCIQPRRSRGTARSSNHGVTIEAERRFSRGLFFQVAYTAARDLGDTVVGGPSGFIQQADMRRLKLGFRLEW
jgi:hypothetical protein